MIRSWRAYSKLLSYVLSFVMAACIIISASFILSTITLCNYEFLYRQFTKDYIINAVSDELEASVDLLSAETGIPADVFMSATNKSFLRSTQSTVLRDMRTGKSTDFSDVTDLRNRYKSVLSQYFNEHNVEMSNKRVDEIADQAVRVFNETLAVKNNAQISVFVKSLDGLMIPVGVFCLVLFFVLAARQYYINGKRHKGFAYIAMSLMCAGEIMVVLPGLLMYKNSVEDLETTNIAVHNMAITDSFDKMLLAMIVIGVVLMICSAAIFTSNAAYYKAKLMACDAEDAIMNKLILEQELREQELSEQNAMKQKIEEQEQ